MGENGSRANLALHEAVMVGDLSETLPIFLCKWLTEPEEMRGFTASEMANLYIEDAYGERYRLEKILSCSLTDKRESKVPSYIFEDTESSSVGVEAVIWIPSEILFKDRHKLEAFVEENMFDAEHSNGAMFLGGISLGSIFSHTEDSLLVEVFGTLDLCAWREEQ